MLWAFTQGHAKEQRNWAFVKKPANPTKGVKCASTQLETWRKTNFEELETNLFCKKILPTAIATNNFNIDNNFNSIDFEVNIDNNINF